VYHNITYTVTNRVAYISLNRPEKRNAFNASLVAELKQAFSAAANDVVVKVIVLRANGKVFSAGADLSYLQTLQNNSYEENVADSKDLMGLFVQIYEHPKVVIAQVEGHAIAGGCGLSTVCDIVFSVPKAKFGYTEVKIGFIPAIVMVFLLRKIGETHAKHLLLSGSLIDAVQAQTWGLVNFVVEPNLIAEAVTKYAQKLCMQTSAQSLRMTKHMIGKVQSMPLLEALNYAAEMNAQARATSDCKRGIHAFLNKEKLQW